MKNYILSALILISTNTFAQQTPDKIYGQLFTAVQEGGIFADSKSFVDCTPKRKPKVIVADYLKKKTQAGFDLKKFVADNFTPQVQPKVINTEANKDIVTHINDLWKVLQRKQDKKIEGSSLLALPKPYIVPGGRFTEVYYWDSYFTMLGLKESGETVTIENMIDNFAHLINTHGHIPNGNRSYYLSRSQPPFFGMMVNLLAEIKGAQVYKKYLSTLQKEYNYWMAGLTGIKLSGANKRVVKLSDGTVLNRYCDDLDIPRHEGYKEDVATAEKKLMEKMSVIRFASEAAMNEYKTVHTKRIYNNLRSAAESGWDFSSRWFYEENDLGTIHTTDIIPVDLNALLMVLEQILQNNGGKVDKAIAIKRKAAMHKYFWNEAQAFYCDYDFVSNVNVGKVTAAGMFPLAVAKYTSTIADVSVKKNEIIATLKNKLLKPGGIVCTEISNGQQWDAPNGWAPLQWMTVSGLINVNEKTLAADIANRWMSLNEKVYKATGKLTEKYNVVDLSLETGGGEYPNLDGFGWTNGVYLAFYKLFKK